MPGLLYDGTTSAIYRLSLLGQSENTSVQKQPFASAEEGNSAVLCGNPPHQFEDVRIWMKALYKTCSTDLVS